MTPENRVACTLVRILVSVTTPRTTTELICDRPEKRCDGIIDCADGRDEICPEGFVACPWSVVLSGFYHQ
jgi:hypothetical protein